MIVHRYPCWEIFQTIALFMRGIKKIVAESRGLRMWQKHVCFGWLELWTPADILGDIQSTINKTNTKCDSQFCAVNPECKHTTVVWSVFHLRSQNIPSSQIFKWFCDLACVWIRIDSSKRKLRVFILHYKRARKCGTLRLYYPTTSCMLAYPLHHDL